MKIGWVNIDLDQYFCKCVSPALSFTMVPASLIGRDVGRELIVDRLANFYVGLADEVVGGREPAEVGLGLQVPDDDAWFHAGRRPLAAGGAASRRPDEWALATSASSTSTISRNSLDNWFAEYVGEAAIVPERLLRRHIEPRPDFFADIRFSQITKDAAGIVNLVCERYP